MRKVLLKPWPYLLVVVTANVAGAFPVPVLHVADLVREADVVAVGTITSISEVGSTLIDTPTNLGKVRARVISGDLVVDQILKGTPDITKITFQFYLPEEPIGYSGVAPSSYRIFFLKRRGNHYEFVSPYYPSVVAFPKPRIEVGTTLDRVAMAVATVLRSRNASPQSKREAIQVLWDIKSPVSVSALRPTLQETDPSLRLSAAAALLAADEVSALAIAEEALLHGDRSVSSELLHNLRVGLSQGVMNEAAIPALTRLLHAGDTETRRAASAALRNTRSPSAIISLATALDDSDFEVRLYAVIGLAEITGQSEWGPSWDGFAADEGRYLRHWKEWIRVR